MSLHKVMIRNFWRSDSIFNFNFWRSDLYAKMKDAVTNVFDSYINKPCFGASIEFFF